MRRTTVTHQSEMEYARVSRPDQRTFHMLRHDVRAVGILGIVGLNSGRVRCVGLFVYVSRHALLK